MSDTLMDPLNCLIYGVAGRLVARSGARTVSPLDNLYGRPRLRLRFFLSVLVTTSAGSVLRCARANTLGVESLQYDGKHSAAIKANTATIATSTVTGSAKSPLSVGCVAGGAGDDAAGGDAAGYSASSGGGKPGRGEVAGAAGSDGIDGGDNIGGGGGGRDGGDGGGGVVTGVTALVASTALLNPRPARPCQAAFLSPRQSRYPR